MRNATSSLFIQPQFWRCHLQPVCIGCRLLCSSTIQSTLQVTQHSHELSLPRKPNAELSLRHLVDMGFTETQAARINDAVTKVRGGSAAKHALSTLTALFVLGLNASSVLKALEKCPELYAVKELQLQQRIGNLRKLGFVEGEIIVLCSTVYESTVKTGLYVGVLHAGSTTKGVLYNYYYYIVITFIPRLGSLQRVVAHYPQILTVPVKTVKNAVVFLREKCLFTVQQAADILRDSPAIVVENMGQLEYKFQVSI